MLNEFLSKLFLKPNTKQTLFKSIAIDIAAILMWRGIWGLSDLYVFPEHPEFSLILSTILGLSIILILRYKG